MAKEVPADELAARRLKRAKEIKEAEKRLKSSAGDNADLSEKKLGNKLCMEIAELISGGVLGFGCHIYEDTEGDRKVLVENDRREVRFVSDDVITSAIYQYIREKSLYDPNYLMSIHDVESVFKMWKKSKVTLHDVPKLSWLSDDGLCFKRLPFDYVEKESYEHPTWDKILANIEKNKDAFMAFIGSIFEPKSYKQQYLWMHGSGGDGKGSLFDFLSELMGDKHCVHVKTNIEHDFWTENLASARVAYFADCKRYDLPDCGEFLTYSGEAPIIINKKNKCKFEVKNNLKFIIGSNQPPKISNLEKDVRRAIIVPFVVHGKKERADPVAFKEALLAEGSEFVCHCVNVYRAGYGKHHGEITVDRDHLEGVTSAGDEAKRAFLDEHFATKDDEQKLVSEGALPAAILSSTYSIAGSRLTQYLTKYYTVNESKQTEFRTWLKHQPGITYSKQRVGYRQTWYFSGLREKRPKTNFSPS